MMQKHSGRMRRLVAAGLLPERAGQPVKVVAHISLADLMVLEGSSALLEEWTSRVRAQWAGHRAAASAGGSDGGAWLDSDAAQAVACDAAMAPFVTGEVNPAALTARWERLSTISWPRAMRSGAGVLAVFRSQVSATADLPADEASWSIGDKQLSKRRRHVTLGCQVVQPFAPPFLG